jgi:glycosyltransferase involved in cell wall biosynthesis
VVPREGWLVETAQGTGLPVEVLRAPAPLQRYGEQRTHRVSATPALIRYWTRLSKVFRQADLVQVNDLRGMLLAGPAARYAGRPLVWMLHSAPDRSLPARAACQIARITAGHVLVPSAATADGLGPALLRRTTMLRNPLLRQPKPVDTTPSEPPTIVTAGRLHPVKGLDVLLRSVALLRDAGEDLRLLVLGEPDPAQPQHLSDLLRLVDGLGLEGIVTMPGHVTRPDELWSGAVAYVQASRQESFGLAALEAAASGLPLVLTRTGGLPELLRHGAVGVLAEAGDPGSLHEAITRVLHSPALRQEARSAAAAITSAHSPGGYVDNLSATYRSALGQRWSAS